MAHFKICSSLVGVAVIGSIEIEVTETKLYH